MASFEPIVICRPLEHDYLVAVDSDGCAFDTMELKQKECFIPEIIRFWGLQPISRVARETAEFVNLYSAWRGMSRFRTLIKLLDLLAEHPEVLARGFPLPATPGLRTWLENETAPSNSALRRQCQAGASPDMHTALAWTEAIDERVAEMVGSGIPPFPYVRDALTRASERADVLVCSVAPLRTLRAEWEGQGLMPFVSAIGGQECGSKARHIQAASNQRHAPARILMIGDGPGDLATARETGASFYPIQPGREGESWRRLHEACLDSFFDGNYGTVYEPTLVREFERALPTTAPWQHRAQVVSACK